MSRPGRGFIPRGSSYRGRGTDSSWNSRGRGSSTFSGPSRGRFNYFNNSSGFDSRKYSGNSSGERYSSRGRGGGEDSSYRRYPRADSSYSGRDHSHHRSPESSRKRLRTDSYGSQASSSRRSHEGSYGGGGGGGGDFNDRYSFSEDKSSSYTDRYRDERRTSSFRDRSREEFTHRKSDSTMPPPSSPRHLPSRGTYRGRMPFRGSRGMSRILQSRRNDSLIARRNFSEGYAIRKRVFPSKASADAWRKMKLQKLRRLTLSKKIDKDDDKEEEDDDDDASNDDADVDVDVDVDVEKADDELEEGETVDSKEPAKKKVKKDVVEEEREEGEEVDDEDEDDEGKELVEGDGGVQVTIKQDSDTRDVSEEVHKRPKVSPGFVRRTHFIRLSCPHCYYRCVTFKEYIMHLHSVKHVSAMRRQSLQHKQKLINMRVSQRQEQRLLEESEESDGLLASYSSFCHVCKLNFRQHKARHFASSSHIAMKAFLMPYCRVCRLSFKSPMLYENHLCSLEHIKLKARIEERMLKLKSETNASLSEEDSDEKETDKYVTLDSIGTVDAEGVELEEDTEPLKEDEEKEKSAVEDNPGAEYLRKVEVYFCELCRLYLPRADMPERSIAKHCNSGNHLQKYIRYRRDKVLRKQAERIHQKDRAEKKAKAKKLADSKKPKEESENGTEEADETIETTTAVETKAGPEEEKTAPVVASGAAPADPHLIDEKTWADVDKDLGDLLDQVVLPDNKGSSDEDDEGASGRYDRFGRSSQKELSAEPSSEGKAASQGEEKSSDALQDKEVLDDTVTSLANDSMSSTA